MVWAGPEVVDLTPVAPPASPWAGPVVVDLALPPSASPWSGPEVVDLTPAADPASPWGGPVVVDLTTPPPGTHTGFAGLTDTGWVYLDRIPL